MIESTLRRINWDQARADYITGSETYQQIADRLGVTLNGVERHSLNRRENVGETWGQIRSQFRAELSQKVTAEIGARLRELTKQIALSRLDVSVKALELIKKRLEQELEKTPDLIAIAKLGIDPRLEVGGENGEPIDVNLEVSAGDDATRSLIAAALEAALGRQAKQSGPAKQTMS